jgi:hypothetical protein
MEISVDECELLPLTRHRFVGSGLLQQFIPGFCVSNEMRPVLHFNFFKSFNTSSFHQLFGRHLDRIPTGFHSVIFVTVFVFSILLRCPHHFILCHLTYLTL